MMDEHPSDARILLAFDDELDLGEIAVVVAHVDACPACRAVWERLAGLSVEIEQYCRVWPAAGTTVPVASPAWRAEIAAAARGWWQRPRRVQVTSGPARLAAAAAVLLAIAGGVLTLRSGPSPTAPTSLQTRDIPLASSATPTASGAAAAKMAAPGAGLSVSAMTPAATGTPIAVPRRVRGPASTRAAARAQATAAAATAAQREPTYYWALPYANNAVPLSEGAVVMTVRLSRDQLRLAGIPVSVMQPASDQQLVRARVLVGADGLPRAISFDQD